MRRVVVGLALALVLAWLAPVGQAARAGASTAEDEARFVARLNEARAAAGLPALVVDDELTALSRSWAEAMRQAGAISHANPISAGLTAPWLKLGENVGTGPSVDAVMDAFIASPGHYANIVDPEFTHVGVAVVWDGNRLYTTHRFMTLQPTQPEPPPVTAPPTTTTAPVPAAPPPAAPAPPATTAPPPAPVPPPAAVPDPARTGRVHAVVAALQTLAAT